MNVVGMDGKKDGGHTLVMVKVSICFEYKSPL